MPIAEPIASISGFLWPMTMTLSLSRTNILQCMGNHPRPDPRAFFHRIRFAAIELHFSIRCLIATWSPPRPKARSRLDCASVPSSGKDDTAEPTPMLKVSGTFCLEVVSLISSKIENFPFSSMLKDMLIKNSDKSFRRNPFKENAIIPCPFIQEVEVTSY